RGPTSFAAGSGGGAAAGATRSAASGGEGAAVRRLGRRGHDEQRLHERKGEKRPVQTERRPAHPHNPPPTGRFRATRSSVTGFLASMLRFLPRFRYFLDRAVRRLFASAAECLRPGTTRRPSPRAR